MEIFTSAGLRVRVVRAAEVSDQHLLQVNVAGLAAGLYFVAVHGKEGIDRGRFVVVR